MDNRRESFSSCVSDSECDGESVAGSYVNLSTGKVYDDKKDGKPNDIKSSSSSSSVRSRLRRTGVKRQAPQPPSRPSAPTAPTPPGTVTTDKTNIKPISPITTVHLQFEPQQLGSLSTPSNEASTLPAEHTHNIVKIISEPVDVDPLLIAKFSSPSVSGAVQSEQDKPPVDGIMSRSVPVRPNQIIPPDSHSLHSSTNPPPHHQKEILHSQPLSQPSQAVLNATSMDHTVFTSDKSQAILPPQQNFNTHPIQPQIPKTLQHKSQPSISPRPMSPTSSIGPLDSVTSIGGSISPIQNLSRTLRNVDYQNQGIMTHDDPGAAPVVMPPPRGVPSHLLGSPNVPQRSPASQGNKHNLNKLRIRLIDDDSESEAYQSDATEELRPNYQPPLAGGMQAYYRQNMPSSYCNSDSGIEAYPPPHRLLHKNAHRASNRTPVFPENYDFNSSFDESSVSEVGSSADQYTPALNKRTYTKRLAHSASDPGVGRPQRILQYPEALQQQQQCLRNCQRVTSPTLPPLEQLSEDGGPSDSEDLGQQEEILRHGLQRSNSQVTVAHLYEDVLVSNRLRIRVTLTNLTVVVVMAALLLPNTAITLFTVFRLVFGTLFPAYYSYKAVKTKNVKEYVKWMMYWIVFAFFTCFETFTDLFFSFWFPFYYELKILVVLWLLSPATRGSSILYRKFVHPWLTRREDDIDNCIAQAKQQGYSTVIQLGTKGVNYATTVLMQTAIKGGGGLVSQLRRSYSSGELSDGGDMNRNVKALPNLPDDYDERSHSSGPYDVEPRIRAESDAAYRSRGSSVNRGARSNKTRSADVTDYYQDSQDEVISRRRSPRSQETGSHVISADDLTSGYSSGAEQDAGDLIYDLRHDPIHDNHEIIPEPKKSSKVRRTQSLSASTINNHRSQRVVKRGEGREGLRSSGSVGRGSGPVDDLSAHASYSSSGHPAASHHSSSFKRSRPGEISAYATLPRTTNKRTAAAKKRQV